MKERVLREAYEMIKRSYREPKEIFVNHRTFLHIATDGSPDFNNSGDTYTYLGYTINIDYKVPDDDFRLV